MCWYAAPPRATRLGPGLGLRGSLPSAAVRVRAPNPKQVPLFVYQGDIPDSWELKKTHL